jgi:remodeling and spacing factor 1
LKSATKVTRFECALSQDEVELAEGAGNQGKGKDISTIVNAEEDEPVEKVDKEFEPEPEEKMEEEVEEDEDKEESEEEDDDG